MRETDLLVMDGMNVLVQLPAVQPAVREVEPTVMEIVQRHNSSQNVCHLHGIEQAFLLDPF